MSKKFFINTSIYFTSRLITLIFSFFSASLFGRYLGASNYGVYSYSISVSSILVVFLNMGSRNYITRELIGKKNKHYFLGNFFLLRILIFILLEIILLLYIFIVETDKLTQFVLLIIGTTVFLNSFLTIFFSLNRSVENYYIESLNQVIVAFLTLLGYFLLLTNGYGLKSITIFLLSLSILQNIVIGYISLRYSHIHFSLLLKDIKLSESKRIFRELTPFLLTSIFSIIFFRIDTVMLKFYWSSKIVGFYSGAYKFFELSTYIPDVLLYILFPILVKKSLEDKKNLIAYYRKFFKYLLLISLPASILLYSYSKDIILLIWGDKFYPSINILKILSFAMIFVFLNYISGNIIISLKKEKILTRNTFIIAIFNIVSNIYFIPLWKAKGAAFTTLVSEALFQFLNFIVIGKFLTFKVIKIHFFSKIILLNILFFFIIKNFFIKSLFIGPVIYMSIYILLLFLFKLVDKKEFYSI